MFLFIQGLDVNLLPAGKTWSMGNPTFSVFIVLSGLCMSPEPMEMATGNKFGVWTPTNCNWIASRNLCCTQNISDSFSYLSSSVLNVKKYGQTIKICDTEQILWLSQKGRTVIIVLNNLKQYYSCYSALIYIHRLELKKYNVDSFGAEDYIHLRKTQRLCTSTWSCIKANSSLYDGYKHAIAERPQNHSNYGGKKKTELLTKQYYITVRLPNIFHYFHKHTTVPKHDFQFLCKPLFRLEKFIFGLILVIIECIILLSYAKHGLKFYYHDLSHKLSENGKYGAINPQMKVLSPTDAERTDIKPEATTSFVFRFRRFNVDHSFVYPASLDHYFKEVFHSKQSSSDLYRYEWARYKSFKHYPDSAVVLPLLLAKDGFYYTGYEDEVTCHFCGFTYRNWKRGDNVHNTHKTLSKYCKFVSGGETDNVSITGCNGQFHNNTVEGACGGSSDTNAVTENLNKLNLKETTNAESLQNTDKGEKLSGAVKKDTLTTNNDNDKRNITDTDSVSPKHPAYAVDAVRLSSYSKWPAVVVPSPTVLCDAGFFYAGFGDCVRCFFCGGGLRNWEYGDTPWVEHARWYPTCRYLFKRKGQQFIEMHRQDFDREEEVAEASANSQHEETATITRDQEPSENVSAEEERSPAMQTILEMGYAQDIVLSAIEILRQRGNEHYTATDIMEIILENDRKSSDPTRANNTLSAQNGESEDSESFEHPPLLNGNTTARPGGDMARPNKPPKTGKQQRSTELSYLSQDCQSLMRENRQLKDQLLCKICMDKDACMVFLPCGHMVSCMKCSSTVRKCCICRKMIKGIVKAYL